MNIRSTWCIVVNLRVNELFHVGRQVASLRQLAGECTNLRLLWNLASEEQPEHTLRKDLLAVLCSRELLLAVWNGETMEPNTLDANRELKTPQIKQAHVGAHFVRVQNGCFPEHGLEAAHASDQVLDLHSCYLCRQCFVQFKQH